MKLMLRKRVIPSPTTPESLYAESAGTVGDGGGTVSTENANGDTVIVGRGAISLAVSVCAPSASAAVVVMQTFPLPAEWNVPIETPSMSHGVRREPAVAHQPEARRVAGARGLVRADLEVPAARAVVELDEVRRP